MADIWTFFECGIGDEWLITEHLDGAPAVIEVKFNERCRHLLQRPLPEWTPNWTKPLTGGNCDGLIEVRFKAEKVQQRPLAFFGPKPGQLTFVLWAIEKGGKFVPKDACEIGKHRESEIRAGKREIRPLTFE